MKAPNQHPETLMVVSITALIVCCAITSSDAEQVADPCRLTWEIAPEISYIKYTEPGLMKDKGYMYGIGASLVYRGPTSKPLFNIPEDANSWMFRGDARFNYGRVDYDGALSDGTPYEVHGIEDVMLEFRMLLGYDFANKVARVTPYLGFGYRYLRDDTSFDPAGYERESNYLYIPLGFELHFPSASEWSLGATVEYDVLAWGLQRSNLDRGYGVIENRQRSGNGFRASVRFQKTQPGADFGIEPFVRFWNIPHSAVDDGFIEPKNRSVEVGLKLVWIF